LHVLGPVFAADADGAGNRQRLARRGRGLERSALTIDAVEQGMMGHDWSFPQSRFKRKGSSPCPRGGQGDAEYKLGNGRGTGSGNSRLCHPIIVMPSLIRPLIDSPFSGWRYVDV